MSARLQTNAAQRLEYLDLMDRLSGRWVEVFAGNETFYSTVYWDLFKTLWRAPGPVTKTRAMRSMTGVKSAHTAGRYLEVALTHGLVLEEDNPADRRSKYIRLAPEMRERLDAFFDVAVRELQTSARRIEIAGPAERAS